MPDQYIDETYVEAHLGTGYVNAVQAVDGVDLETIIESSTALVQGALSEAGYSTPATTSDERVKAATLGLVRVQLASVPEGAIPLPEGWNDNPLNPIKVFEAVVDGRLPILGHTLTTATAVGGWQASSHSTTSSTGLPQRSSRRELSGF